MIFKTEMAQFKKFRIKFFPIEKKHILARHLPFYQNKYHKTESFHTIIF